MNRGVNERGECGGTIADLKFEISKPTRGTSQESNPRNNSEQK
jgi:hypothetical protein